MHFVRSRPMLIVFGCLLGILGSSLPAADCLVLKMRPDHALHLNPALSPQLNISCTLQDEHGTPVALAGCEFRNYYRQVTWPMNDGPASPSYNNDGLVGNYHGRGLEQGDCGLTLGGYGNGYVFIVGCRVRPAVGGPWQYAATLLDIDGNSPTQFHLKPAGVTLAQAGSEVTLLGKSEHELTSCWFKLPPLSPPALLNFDSGHASAKPRLGSYHGAGLEHKECGVTLTNVQPERSGFVRAEVSSSSPMRGANDFVELIVATAPESPPLLTVITPGELHVGDTLEAKCIVKNSRPAANITWHVGADEVTSGISDESLLDSAWRWNHDPQTVEQRLRLQVVSSHHGKKLLCRAGHMALPSGYQYSISHDVRVIGADGTQ